MYCTELWSSEIIHLTREWIFEECNNNIHVTMRTSVNEFGEHTHSFKSWSRTVEGCWNYCSMQNVQRFRSSHIPKKCNLYQFRTDDNSTGTSANHFAVLSSKTFAFWRQKYKFFHVSNMLKWDILGLKFYSNLFSNSWCEIKSFQKVKKWQWYSAIYV